MIFKRKPLFYAGKRRLIKWLRDDLITELAAIPVVSNWILATNFWDDAGVWIDGETWND